jgi:hypothetical protein
VILRPVTIALLALIVTNLSMVGVALAQYPAFFSQPAALLVVAESVSVLLTYAVVAVWVGRTRGPDCDAIVRNATLFGLLGGTVEALNIGVENGIPAAIHSPVLPIAFMFTIFASWGVAGFRTARSLNSIRAG